METEPSSAPQSARRRVLPEVDEHGHQTPSEQLQTLRLLRELLVRLGAGLSVARADDRLEVCVGLGEQVAHRMPRTLLQRELVCARRNRHIVLVLELVLIRGKFERSITQTKRMLRSQRLMSSQSKGEYVVQNVGHTKKRIRISREDRTQYKDILY